MPPKIRSGKVRGLATLGLTRIAALPELPTLAEQGLEIERQVKQLGLKF